MTLGDEKTPGTCSAGGMGWNLAAPEGPWRAVQLADLRLFGASSAADLLITWLRNLKQQGHRLVAEQI